MDYLKAIYQQNQKILAALEDQKRWVKVSVITELTGWTKEDLRRNRMNGRIEWKREKGTILYNANSIKIPT